MLRPRAARHTARGPEGWLASKHAPFDAHGVVVWNRPHRMLRALWSFISSLPEAASRGSTILPL
jgi:hypothetical protein